MSIPRGAMACLLAAVLLSPAIAAARADTVPHEEFEDEELDLAALKLLLDESLRLATESLLSCVDENTASACSDVADLVESLEAPAAVIEDLSSVADSYAYLALYVPPFDTMASDDSEVVAEFCLLVENITTLRLLADHAVVPAEVYEQAMELLAQTNAYIQELLMLVDGLEEDVLDIDALPDIPDQDALNVTPLLDAIDALRDKLRALDGELDRLAENILSPTPTLFLLANSDELFLGQTLILTGYLFYMGTFVPDLEVRIERDGSLFRTADSGESGRFSEAYDIAIDEAELGSWTFVAETVYMDEDYTSSDLVVNVTRIPTVIELDVSPSYQVGSDVALNGSLTDHLGHALVEQDVSASVDGVFYTYVTDVDGEFAVSLATSELGFGTHTVSAAYDGNGTHAPSSTPVLEFMLKYPALLTLAASDGEVALGDTVVLSGMLTNLTLEPIGGATVYISINGVRYSELTSGPDGSLQLSIDTDELGPGTHVAFAEHDDPASPWFYTRSGEVEFKVVGDDSGFIPGIITNPDDLFREIIGLLEAWFLGEYWYIAWTALVILAVLLYVAYRRHRARSEERRAQEERLRKDLMLDAPIFKPRVRPLDALPAGSRKLMKATLWKMIDTLLGSMSPRDAIVHGYGRFLQFLAQERSTPMDDSLTHREIQAELVFVGYPKDTVGSVTRVYEKAMYTKREVTVEDALEFADSLAVLEGFGKVVPE